jgi:hypothetical protein
VTSKKTVLRSIRFSQENAEILEQDAKMKGLSVNALLSMMITKYVEWDRYAERFGYVSMTREGHREMMNQIDDEKLVTFAKQSGAKIPIEMTLFWFKKLNLQTFFSFIAVHSKYSRGYQYEIQSEGRNHTITFHHDLGPKYTIFLQHYYDQAIRNIVGVAPKIQARHSSLTLSFQEPTP